VGFVEVFLNGSKLSAADFTATNGSSVVLASGAAVGDTVDVVAFATQTVANVYTQSQSDARYLQLTGGTLTGDLTGTTSTFSGDVTIADKIVHSGDTNTAIRFPAVDTVTVETNGSEAFRIDSGGHALFTLATNAVGNFADNVGEVGSGNFCLQVSNTAQDALKPLGFRAEDIRFATGSAERMRIDSSGNVLVGTTSTSLATTSSETGSMIADGSFQAAANNPVAQFNRITTDGAIVNFRHDGSTVGSIGNTGSNPFFANATTGGFKFGTSAGSTIVDPVDETGAVEDATHDIGSSGGRWRNGYFSTNVHANALVHDGDTNTKIEFPAADEIELHTNGIARLKINNTVIEVNGALDIEEVKEKVDAKTSTTGTINFDFLEKAIENFTANQTANRTINFRGDSGTTLNSIMSTGQSMTAAILMTQGSTAYYLNAYQIDGSSVTPKWQGGSAPSGGNASSIDAYSFTIIKTADATFTVLASQTKFA
jgi:putative lipoic acid-binding regulatory protein